MPEVCPKTTKNSLVEQCRQAGLTAGDAVMVHAGVRAVGPILGGPDMLIAAILETIGTRGTMMMYLGCEMPFDDVGRPNMYTPEDEEFIIANCPPFDPMQARAARSHGILAEFFRTTDGVICSSNPGCRMAAVGEQARRLLDNHPLNYGLGKDSPLDRFCGMGGKLFLIGTELDTTTLLHYAEAIAPIPNKAIVHIKVPMPTDGVTKWIDVEEFDSSTGIRDWLDEQFFGTIVRQYLKQNSIEAKYVGNAESYLISAKDLVEFAVPTMVRAAEELDAVQSR